MSGESIGGSLPQHIAVIMDGNGRWAAERGLERTEGHRAGVRVIEPIVRTLDRLGVGALTLYSFSTENWNRPKTEVSALMELLREFFVSKLPLLVQMGVRVRVLGDRQTLPSLQSALVEHAENATRHNTGLALNIAFNYGSRAEIVQATRRIVKKVLSGELSPDAIDETALENEFYTAGLPPVDLLIRTGGEMRLSNYLLYQLAYAELSFIPEYWPDFTPDVLIREIQRYACRDRRFGGLSVRERISQ